MRYSRASVLKVTPGRQLEALQEMEWILHEFTSLDPDNASHSLDFYVVRGRMHRNLGTGRSNFLGESLVRRKKTTIHRRILRR